MVRVNTPYMSILYINTLIIESHKEYGKDISHSCQTGCQTQYDIIMERTLMVTGQYPPGHVPPGHLPQGHLPPGHLPPGHLPPGHLPPRTHTPWSLTPWSLTPWSLTP